MERGLTVRGVHLPAGAFEWRFTGAGGPGGQHANTANTAVELRLDVEGCDALPARLKDRIRARLGSRMTRAGELVVQASEHRSQRRNRDDAMRRMAELLDEGIRPPAKRRTPTRPSRASQRRRVEDKRRRGALKAQRQGRDWPD
ncbi:alternative ribosome rescue aminoacyl-tRNA hydrolase ArfB [Euzebya sp.]|uniref:alternative ribosome rescue aminoacyl-tRNA hydrolase ArfB n=1 Tax=Euzebya sp. TaxID=1971409 RepID=UPI003512E88C